MSRGMHFSEDEARVLLDRINKTAPLQQDQHAGYRKLEQVSRKHSPAEVIFAHQLHVLQLPAAKRNLRFYDGRKFELDFAWEMWLPETLYPRPGVAIEIQGDVHRIKQRADGDTEKFFLAALKGWTVIPVSTRDVRSGRAAAWLTTMLDARGMARFTKPESGHG